MIRNIAPLTKLCALVAFVLTLTGAASAQAPQGMKVYTQIEYDRANALFTKESAPSALTATVGAAGNVNVGSHDYVVTFVTANGETDGGAVAAITISTSAKQVSLTNIPTGSSFVTARKIWRSKASAPLFETDKYYLLTTISNNTSTTYTDNTADSGLTDEGRLLQNNSTAAALKVGTTATGFIGERNTVFGFNSQPASSIGSYNTVFGARAALNNTGDFNFFGGYEAGLGNTTGYHNSFVGSQAGSQTNSGVNNTAVGQVALYGNTTSSGNTAVGSQAMWFPQVTVENVAVGLSAMRGTNGSTGSYNTAIGPGALYSFTTASQNVGIGWNALASITTGNNNTGVGFQSGYRLSPGAANNTFVGSLAGYGNAGGATGTYNTGLGQGSLYSFSTGQDNAGVGSFSLNNVTTGSFNIGIGSAAGDSITTGTNNSFLGRDADAASGALDHATAIGAEAVVSNSNEIMLGRSASQDSVRVPGLLVQQEGAVLSISANAIAPTNSIHHVGAGLIKTITLPTNFTSGTIYFIPDAAFTTDQTGNIASTGTTAVVGKVIVATYSSSAGKWYLSY